MILKRDKKYKVTDKTGTKNLGTYDTLKEAKKRLAQIHYFKYLNK